MANSIEIANLALSNIRARTIQTFTEDSLEAQVMLARYDIARQYVLRQFPWGFANRTEPAALVTVDPQKYLYAYAYPNNCLKLKHIVPYYVLGTDRTVYLRFGSLIPEPQLRDTEELNIPYEIANENGVQVILTDMPEAYLQYTIDEKDTNLYSPDFVEMLSWWLASQVAVPIAGAEKGREMRRDALRMYDQIRKETQVANANERFRQKEDESEYTQLREQY